VWWTFTSSRRRSTAGAVLLDGRVVSSPPTAFFQPNRRIATGILDMRFYGVAGDEIISKGFFTGSAKAENEANSQHYSSPTVAAASTVIILTGPPARGYLEYLLRLRSSSYYPLAYLPRCCLTANSIHLSCCGGSGCVRLGPPSSPPPESE